MVFSASRTDETRVKPRSGSGSPTSFRGDIEGLRAVAVLLVLLGHASRQLLPGGFVGVDVFFVISGFLITGLLLAELNSRGRISLINFYSRRAKRLLPAACVVLLVTLLLTFLFLPRTRWSDTAWDVVASSLYAMNWRLAAQSVDYLAANRAPSALQHFWSLGVEEQFYLLWPLLLIALAWISHRGGGRLNHLLLIGFALVAVPSFAWSIHLAATDPAPAYFVTTTRMWELAIGGGLALIHTHLHRTYRPISLALAWSGLAAIVVSAILIRSDSGFPGYTALAPTLGTAIVIGFGPAAGRWGPALLLARRPFQAIGAVSYSLYLWHWPLLVVATARFGELTPATGLTVAALSAIPSALTYRYVENPIRRSEFLSYFPGRALAVGALCTGLAVLSGLFFQLTVWPPPRPAVSAAKPIPLSTDSGQDQGPAGAAVLTGSTGAGAPVNSVRSITPDPLAAREDGPDIGRDGCHVDQRSSVPKACVYGEPDSTFTIALAGDSHAAQWLPALQRIALTNKWRLVRYTKSSCPFINIEIALKGRAYTSCTEWNEAVRTILKTQDKPDILVTSNSAYLTIRDGQIATDRTREALARGLRQTWSEITAAGVPVVVLRDTPYHQTDIAECVSANRTSLTRCASPRDTVLAAGGGPAQEEAAAGLPNVHIVDLNNAICPTERCAPVIGEVLVYRDNNHLTATYVATLAPRLNTALQRLLD